MNEIINGRVRKRAPIACTRCRRQKIKCSGKFPCEHCSRRSVHCIFDNSDQKVFVSQSYLAQLRQWAAGRGSIHDGDLNVSNSGVQPATEQNTPRAENEHDLTADQASPLVEDFHDPDGDGGSESNTSGQSGLRATPEADLTNPLDPSNSDSFTVDPASKRFHLGVSSNWSFGIRVLRVVYEKVHSTPLPSALLFFEGSTYDLGWDGQRASVQVDKTCIPTADFALFLINAVKFHCGRIFHMFDEATFMQHFGKFYEDPDNQENYPRLWYIHFLLILAFGKSFIVRANKPDQHPPGADLFVQAMQLLPDITFLGVDAIQSIEILCCAALYQQCLDNRSAAYNIIGQALRLAMQQGLHTDVARDYSLSESTLERCRQVWWTLYVLDRQMTSLMGVPLGLSDDDVTACLPSFGGSVKKQLALNLHVQLSKANALILQTVYSKSGGRSKRFLSSMKQALRTIAEANDERNNSFPLDLQAHRSGICRLSAYLNLFHHQSLILATRPLLYSFLQKRLDAGRSLRVSSARSARSLLRVCVGSAQQSLSILEALQSQSLLESFIPFDREAAFSSAVILLVAAAVDPSLVKDVDTKLETACAILREMACCGNLIAQSQRLELEQLDMNFANLRAMDVSPASTNKDSQIGTSVASATGITSEAIQDPNIGNEQVQNGFDSLDTLLSEWNSEDGLSGEHLMAVADSLDFEQLEWFPMGNLEPYYGS